jgi:galactose-1-phosphate uridylyltransferase
MKQKSGIEELARVHIKAIRRVTRKVYSSEEKIRIVLSGLFRQPVLIFLEHGPEMGFPFGTSHSPISLNPMHPLAWKVLKDRSGYGIFPQTEGLS